MPPLVFKLARKARMGIRSVRQLGTPCLLAGPILFSGKFVIQGVTRDSGGTPLGSCVVSLYRTGNPPTGMNPIGDGLDELVDRVTSDASTGAYRFDVVGLGQLYYVVAYKAGSPDVSGTTVNTLQGEAVTV